MNEMYVLELADLPFEGDGWVSNSVDFTTAQTAAVNDITKDLGHALWGPHPITDDPYFRFMCVRPYHNHVLVVYLQWKGVAQQGSGWEFVIFEIDKRKL